MDIVKYLAAEFSLHPTHVQNVVNLIDDGKTVPFIARYRKEQTGSMDDQLVRKLVDRLERLRTLDKRRDEILKALEAQAVLDDQLKQKILSAEKMTALEDFYRPFKQKRVTRASAAIQRGLAPLADLISHERLSSNQLQQRAMKYVAAAKGVNTADDALQGARDILAERFSNDVDCRARLRRLIVQMAKVTVEAAVDEDSPYSMYYAYSEPVSRIPDHRILAINRGEREEFLKVNLEIDDDSALNILRRSFILPDSTEEQMELAVNDAWKRLLFPSLERETRTMLTERASASAIEVFGNNLHQLLMQRPVKGRVTLGVDPGFRTGCKLAVVDDGGKVLATGVAHFTIPGMDRRREEAKKIVGDLIRKHQVKAVAIGNGTASREAEAFITELLKEMPEGIQYAIVNEAGASVYSASKLGAEEFPEYDVSLRSAVSIARRLQDPLAELVKIDPKSIGVGQYQHDLKEAELNHMLEGVVEDCVNAVGVELSTASVALLTHVSGIGPALAKNIVAYREENGFSSRAELKKVPKLGPKAFEQAAGFLRLAGSKNILDTTAIHPESYPAAKALIEHFGYHLADLRGEVPAQIYSKAMSAGTKELSAALGIGEPTLKDILDELVKPGRDPRDDLPPTILRSDILSMEDLEKGMKLQGTVRNVIDFGVFVDVGVHQDGLVHISRMSKRFIRHPSEVVMVGDIVDVWVLDVDKKKKRISLSMIEGK